MDSQFEDLRDYEEITNASDITDLLGETIILNRYKDNFRYLYDRCVDVASLCWNNKDERGNKLQHTLIKFKIDINDTTVRVLTLNRFMLSLVFINTVINYIDTINIDDFILHDFLSKKGREAIQDKIVETLMSNGHTIKDLQKIMSRMSLDLKELLIIFSHADMQLYTAENLFLDHYRDSEIIRDINNTEYPPDMQTNEIVEENKRRYKILEEEMTKRGNPFFVANKYTQIVKPKQMEELYINFSQIPDGMNIVPVIMNGNGFKSGYSEMPVLYAGAIAARVPDIMNNDYMGAAGYFNRNLMILTYGSISKTVYDCGSVNPIPITIDETALEMMDGRFYYRTKGCGVLRVFSRKDRHLLGETLWFRSPCTCNLNEDICHVCYGTVALKIGSLVGGSIYTTEIMTSRVSKNILSAKHLLKADAEKIIFSDGFEKYFSIESSAIVPNDERFDIYIKDDYQDNISDSLTVYIGKDLLPITISHYASLIVSDKVIDLAKELVLDDVVYYKINSNKLNESDLPLCNIIPINIMMTAKYMNIMRLFENDITKFENIEDVVVTLMKLLYKTIPLMSTHGELFISKLIRSADNKLLRPNFLIPDPPYQLLRLKTALQNVESVTTALSFEQTRHHLLHQIFDERNEIKRVGPRSFADYLFGEEIL